MGPYHRPQLNCLDQTDPELLSFLKEEFLWPPFQGKYDMEQIAHARSQQPGFENRWSETSIKMVITIPPFLSFSQQGQDMFLDRVIFKSRVRNGFFIEAGADDLLKDSNTLFFELERDWTGILVEPVLWEKRWITRTKCFLTKRKNTTQDHAGRHFSGMLGRFLSALASSPTHTLLPFLQRSSPLNIRSVTDNSGLDALS